MLDSTLSTGSARVEIELFPGQLIARGVHVEADDDEEKIVSNVTAIDPGQGTISLELGGLTVSYGAGTRFRTETESHESRAAWEAAVQSELAAGRRPPIEARRNPSGSPQAPDDPTFVAADLRLENDTEEPKIEIYVDDDNHESVSGSSVAVIRVLGLAIELNGRTQLDNDDDEGDLFTLDSTADAVARGRPVRAEGRGTVESGRWMTEAGRLV